MPGARLPPLNSLRAFEVAARHLSFKHAADELCITPTAVSHRIRRLEDWLGVKLFNRLTRSLEMTKEGEAYVRQIHDGFQLLATASEGLQRSVEGGELVVSTTMSLASNWLTHKLLSFNEIQDDLTVRLEATDLVNDLTRSNVDVAIRYGEGGYENLYSEMLFSDFICPVCSPSVAEQISRPEDILDFPLIDYRWSGFADGDPTWQRWFDIAGVPADPQTTHSFSDEHMAMTLALNGAGIALVGIVASATSILSGQLVRPIPIGFENNSFYFTCLPIMLARHKVRLFRDWLKDEALTLEAVMAEDERLRFDRKVVMEDIA